MQRHTRPEDLDLSSSTRPARSTSISSDIPSLSGRSLRSPPSTINPEPIYIAASAASHLISGALEVDDAIVSTPALSLVNGFLDQLLFRVLQAARSTQLNALRPAVLRVLQNKLGEKAIENADEELQEYLGDGKDEELTEFRGGKEPRGEFDLELAWKLARLRCMVYTRLGDMEEEDEDTFIEEGGLDEGGDGPRRYSNHASSCTPAAAIFLTSILETLGESALYFAAQATQRRAAYSPSSRKADSPDVTALPSPSQRTVVEEVDVQQLRDSPMKKLWRNWRTTLKGPRTSARNPFSSPLPHSRKGSISTMDDSIEHSSLPRASIGEAAHRVHPSQIPLPMSEDDVREIEIPGLAIEKEETLLRTKSRRTESKRPRSMLVSTYAISPPTPTRTDASPSPPEQRRQARPPVYHTRSSSLPTPSISPLASPATEYPFETPMESRNAMEHDSPQVSSPDVSSPMDNTPLSSAHAVDLEHEGSATASMCATLQGGISYSDAATASYVLEASDQPATTAEDIVDDYAQDQSRSFLHVDSEVPVESPHAQAGASEIHAYDEPRPSDMLTEMPPPYGVVHDTRAEIESARQNTQSISNARSPFVLEAPPRHRSPPLRDTPAESQTSDQVSKKSGHSSRRPPDKAANAAPSSRPQETPNAALNTLNDNTRFESETGIQASQNNNGYTSGASNIQKVPHHGKKASASSTRGAQPPYPGVERAAVQRVPASPHSRDASINRLNRSTSTSSSSNKRPETGVSHITARKGSAAIRPSLDETQTLSGGSVKEVDEKKQSLEMLIQSDETLHYTLTPQNMREMESPDSPRRVPPRTGTADLADFLKSTGPPGTEVLRPPTARSQVSVKAVNGLRSNPPSSKVPQPTAVPASHTPIVTADRGKAVSVRNKQSAEPRSAKVGDTRTLQDLRDFADFAKSTGPSGPDELPKSIASRSGKSRVSGDTVTGPVSPIVSTPRKDSLPTVRRQPSDSSNQARKNLFRLQARAPTVPAGEQSDLIDFIREGPPRGGGNHRIPRTVAPFRTTMDSDDIQALGSPRDKDGMPRSSLTSTQDSSVVTKSMHSSFNSRTGLLESTERSNLKGVNGATASAPSNALFSGLADQDDMRPKRKQRRVRDPYAIDTDSEDEGFAPQVDAEESLVDFLRSTAPPPGSDPPPTAGQGSGQARLRQQSAGSESMRNKILRKTSLSGIPQRSNEISPVSPKNNDQYSAPQNNGARPNSPHLAQNGTRIDSYRPTQPTYAAHVDRNRAQKAQAPGVIKQGGVHTATSDLADFFRNTAPPPETRPTYARSPSREESGFSKFFSRRKKLAA